MPPTQALSSTRKALRLQAVVNLSAWWFMLNGLIYLMPLTLLLQSIGVRYEPIVNQESLSAGLGLLWLGFFIFRSVRRAGTQYLVVDFISLFFLLRAALSLRHRLQGWSVTPWEWGIVLVDLGLAGALLLYRTSSQEMTNAEPLLSLNYKVFLKEFPHQVQESWKGISSAWAPTPKKTPSEKPASQTGDKKSAGKSTAVPYMD